MTPNTEWADALLVHCHLIAKGARLIWRVRPFRLRRVGIVLKNVNVAMQSEFGRAPHVCRGECPWADAWLRT